MVIPPHIVYLIALLIEYLPFFISSVGFRKCCWIERILVLISSFRKQVLDSENIIVYLKFWSRVGFRKNVVELKCRIQWMLVLISSVGFNCWFIKYNFWGTIAYPKFYWYQVAQLHIQVTQLEMWRLPNLIINSPYHQLPTTWNDFLIQQQNWQSY